MDLKQLQVEAHQIAREHGWYDTERSFGDCIAEVHAALSRALEAYREHGLKDWRSHTYSDGFVDEHPQGEKPEGVPYELADVVIRVADMAEWYELDLDVVVMARARKKDDHLDVHTWGPDEGSFGDWIAECHELLGEAYWWKHQQLSRVVWVEWLGSLIHNVYQMAAHYGIDLDAAIEAKMQYNRTRSSRHGGKAL